MVTAPVMECVNPWDEFPDKLYRPPTLIGANSLITYCKVVDDQPANFKGSHVEGFTPGILRWQGTQSFKPPEVQLKSLEK